PRGERGPDSEAGGGWVEGPGVRGEQRGLTRQGEASPVVIGIPLAPCAFYRAISVDRLPGPGGGTQSGRRTSWFKGGSLRRYLVCRVCPHNFHRASNLIGDSFVRLVGPSEPLSYENRTPSRN